MFTHFLNPHSFYLNSKDSCGNIIKTASDLCLYLLNSTGVVAVSGDSFGAPGHIRFSYAASDKTIKEAICLVKSALEKLDF